MYISIMLGSLCVYIWFTHSLYVSYIWNVYETVVSINERSSSSFIITKWLSSDSWLCNDSLQKYSSRWKPTGTSRWQYVKTPSGWISGVCTGVWMSEARKQTDVWRSSSKETRLLIWISISLLICCFLSCWCLLFQMIYKHETMDLNVISMFCWFYTGLRVSVIIGSTHQRTY